MQKKEIKTVLQEAQNFRHACKIFDSSKKISDDDFTTILEAARMSPTSFGMQGVRLLVITNQELKEKLKPLCWNQNQIDSCSHLVVLKTRTQDLKPNSKWVKERFGERNLPQEGYERYLKVYEDFHASLTCNDIYEWGTRQAYIMLRSMINAAAMLKIDSCPIEGFERKKVEELLEIDTAQEGISVLVAFGYRLNDAPKKLRLALNEICEVIE